MNAGKEAGLDKEGGGANMLLGRGLILDPLPENDIET